MVLFRLGSAGTIPTDREAIPPWWMVSQARPGRAIPSGAGVRRALRDADWLDLANSRMVSRTRSRSRLVCTLLAEPILWAGSMRPDQKDPADLGGVLERDSE